VIAEGLAARLAEDPAAGPLLERVEVAGPGFVNLTLSPAWYAEAVRAVVAAGASYGAGQATPPERILLE
jgi:arginyl-tRNA synthetase